VVNCVLLGRLRFKSGVAYIFFQSNYPNFSLLTTPILDWNSP